MDMQLIMERLGRIETLLDQLLSGTTPKQHFSTADVASLLNKSEFTVREWCRLGRVIAAKKQSGRGLSSEWVITREELDRLSSDGLLPIRTG